MDWMNAIGLILTALPVRSLAVLPYILLYFYFLYHSGRTGLFSSLLSSLPNEQQNRPTKLVIFVVVSYLMSTLSECH